jgi:hypothetical protein
MRTNVSNTDSFKQKRSDIRHVLKINYLNFSSYKKWGLQ